MATIIKPISNTMALTAANTVFNARVVAVTTNAVTLLTTPSGNLVVAANDMVLITKGPTETLSANVACAATSVSVTG